MITLIVLPLLGIIGVTGYKIMAPAEPEAEQQDDNAGIQALIDEVGPLEKETSRVIAAIRQEESGAEKRAKELSDELYDWLMRWETVMSDYYVDEDHLDLKPGYEAYDEWRQKVSVLRNDLLRVGGF